MRMMKRIVLIGILLILVPLVTCSVKINEKLKDPDFISWLSGTNGEELIKLTKDGNYYYSRSNIKNWEALYEEWRSVVESFVPKEIYKDPDFVSWLSGKNENELEKIKKEGSFFYDYFNNKKWEAFYEEWNKISEPYLIEETYYTRYGVEDKKILKNSKGVIAEKVILRSPYNYAQITGIGYQYPNEKETLFFLIDFQGQRAESMTVSHTKKFLCLDKRGRIINEGNIRINGMPKFIPTFDARQKTTFENEYSGSFIKKTITKIYPCEDCNSINREIGFVW
jgi:hypothetical protein